MITRKVALVLLILFFTTFGSSQPENCSNLESEAQDYLLDGERIGQEYNLRIKNEPNRCIFPVKNSKTENSIIVISEDKGDFIESESKLRETYQFHYTKKSIERNSGQLTNQFKEAERSLNSIESNLPPKLSMSSIVDSAFLRYCPFTIGKMKVCAKNGIEFIDEKSCGLLNSGKNCVDWGGTISKIEELRTTIRDLASARTYSKQDVREFYSQGVAVKEFMLRTDKEVEADLSNIVTISFQEMKTENQDNVEKQVRGRSARMEEVKKEIKGKQNQTVESLVEVENRLERLNNEGYKVKEKYSTYCSLRDNASKSRMRNRIRTEDFREFEKELKSIQTHPIQGLEKTELKEDEGLFSGIDNFFTDIAWDVKGCGWLRSY